MHDLNMAFYTCHCTGENQYKYLKEIMQNKTTNLSKCICMDDVNEENILTYAKLIKFGENELKNGELKMKVDWKKVKLGEIATFSNGVNFGKESYTSGVKLIGVSNFGNKYFPEYEELDEKDMSQVFERLAMQLCNRCERCVDCWEKGGDSRLCKGFDVIDIVHAEKLL